MDAEAIRLLRVMKLKASQAVFAAVLGVSGKLVEAWEQGTRPQAVGVASMLHVFNDNPSLFYQQIQLKEKEPAR